MYFPFQIITHVPLSDFPSYLLSGQVDINGIVFSILIFIGEKEFPMSIQGLIGEDSFQPRN